MSTNQAVSDGLTMTFRAYGFALINSITGASFVSSSVATWKATAANSVDTQLRAAVTNKNITVTTTYGISGGSLIEFSGANVINTSTNNVNAVTPDPDGSDADGLLTCDVTQAFVGKEKIKFKPTSRSSSLCTQCDIYFAIKIGGFFINAESAYEIKSEQVNILTDLMQYWEPLFLGSLILSIISSLLSYILIRVYWRYYVIKIWSKRKKA